MQMMGTAKSAALVWANMPPEMAREENKIRIESAYANRQHGLAGAIGSADPKDTSFFKAMQIAKGNGGGVLLILDDCIEHGGRGSTGPATPFTRIWCSFEETQATNSCHHVINPFKRVM